MPQSDHDTDCECNMVDIGVGHVREPNTRCPVHGAYDSALTYLLPDTEEDDRGDTI